MSTRFSRFVLLTLTCFALSALPAGAAIVANGDFSSGLSGWGVWTAPGSGGNWTTYGGTTGPISGGTGFPEAISGSSAIIDQGDPAAGAIYQDVALDSGATHTLSFKYWFSNAWSDWVVPTPLTFLHTGDDAQLVRIDVIKPAAAPESPDPADVLKVFYMSKAGDPLTTNGWVDGSLDLSEFAGQTVRLRFISTGNKMYLPFGVDNVSVSSTDTVAPALTGVVASPKSFKEKGPGTSFNFTSTKAGTSKLTFSSITKGAKSGKKCVKRTKKLAKAKGCNRLKALKGSITAPVVPGANSIKFNGKLAGKRLKPGKYQATITVTGTTGLVSKATVKFTVKKATKKK